MASSIGENQIARILTLRPNETTTLHSGPEKPKRVLVVEGDGFTRMRLINALTAARFDVRFAANGRLGLTKIRLCEPDVLIVELNLRGLSGLELIKGARRNPNFADRPIYVFTNVSALSRSQRKELATTGAKVYDKKAVAEENFVLTVAKELSDRKSPAAPPSKESSPEANAKTAKPAVQKLPAQPPHPAAAGNHQTGLYTNTATDTSRFSPSPLSETTFFRNHEQLTRDVPSREEGFPDYEPQPEAPAEERLVWDSVAESSTEPLQPQEPRSMAEQLVEVREEIQRAAESEDYATRIEACQALRGKVQAMATAAESENAADAAIQARALCAYLDQLCAEPHQLETGSIQTLEQGVEVLCSLAEQEVQEPNRIEKLNVVIVDGSAESREAIRTAFEKAGVCSATFETYEEATEYLAARPADLIISNHSSNVDQAVSPLEVRTFENQEETPVLLVRPVMPADDSDNSIAVDEALLKAQQASPTEIVVKALNVLQERLKPDTEASPTVTQQFNPLEDAATAANLPEAVNVDSPENRLASGSFGAAESGMAAPANSEPTYAAEADGSGGQDSAAAPQPRSVLLIEDDPTLLKAYTRVLRAAGYHVEVAQDNSAALHALPNVLPDLVVIDVLLPNIEATEILSFIRAAESLKDTRVLILSNGFMAPLTSKVLESGADAALTINESSAEQLVNTASDLLSNLPRRSANPTLEQQPSPDSTQEITAETAFWVRQNNTLRDAPTEIAKIRESCRTYTASAIAEPDDTSLFAFYQRVRFFSSRAGLSGFTKLERLAHALEALLFELVHKRLAPTPAVLRTISQAVDCLGNLAESGDMSLEDPATKPKVLVVDDDRVITHATVSTLKLAQVEAVGTEDPREGLRMLRSSAYDLVIIDVDMPDLNGFDFCEQLRSMPDYETRPVIFITVCSGVDERARGFLVGANDYVVKPITPAELNLKVTMLLYKNSEAEAVETTVDHDTLPQMEMEVKDMPAQQTAPPTAQFVKTDTEPATAIDRSALVDRIFKAENELYLQKERIERRDEKIESLEKELEALKGKASAQEDLRKQLEVAGAATREAQERCDQLEQELEETRKARQSELAESERELTKASELEQRLAQLEEQAAERAESEQRMHEQLQAAVTAQNEAESRAADLEQRANELQQQIAQAEQRASETSDEETGLRQQLETATAEASQAKARATDLERELAALKQAREKHLGESADAADLALRLEQSEMSRVAEQAEMEERVRQTINALSRTTADLEIERAARERTDKENMSLNSRLQEMHEEAKRGLRVSKEYQERITSLEQQLRDKDETVASMSADLQQEREQRERAEHRCRKAEDVNRQYNRNIASVNEANEVLVSAQKNLQTALEANLAKVQQIEARLQQETSEHQRLKEKFVETERALSAQRQTVEKQAMELKQAQEALATFESRTRNDGTEHFRLAESLQSSLTETQMRAEQARIEYAKLQTAFHTEQMERKRLETHVVKLRHSAIDAARTARVVRTNLRRQFRQSVENLSKSTRRLLTLEMTDEQKALAEAILQDVLTVNAQMQESPLARTEPKSQAAPEAPKAST